MEKSDLLLSSPTSEEILNLKLKSVVIRRKILKMLHLAKSGHTGGSLSIVEILVALYFKVMKYDPKNPDWGNRDRLILSKGHAAPALYAVLAEIGYFQEEELWRLRKLGAPLQGHPDSNKTPGVEISTGSLGQGLGIGSGVALALKLKQNSAMVYVILGDGEMQEGMVWEAIMASGHYKLDNLCAILDNNNLQIDGKVSDIMSIYPVEDKLKAFGWNIITIDGHDFSSIISALTLARTTKGKPTFIIAHTVKGKGVSIFENKAKYHGVAPNDEEFEIAMQELQKQEEDLLNG